MKLGRGTFFILTMLSMLLLLTTPSQTSAHTHDFSLERTPNHYSPATPREWQEHQKVEHVGAIFPYNGKFVKTSDDLDLSKYNEDQVFYGCPFDVKITRKTMVIIFPPNDTVTYEQH